MNRRDFDELNRRHLVESARYFHQRSLRRACPLPPRFGLCAALVELWWKDRDALDRLCRPTAEMVRDLVLRQTRHAYLTALPAAASIVSDADRALLEVKYGTRELPANPLDADVAALHGAPVAESHTWTNCAAAPPVDRSGETGLRLLLLRYREGGHRMAFEVESGGRCRFFDPNAGEAAFSDGAHFARWFADFWQAAGYDRRAATATLYRLTTRAVEETPVHGS
jgi:Yersinia/Haemophilus virulence surface antigen